MGLELPAELTEPLSWIGLEWPQADEELLFAAGQQWLAFGMRLQGAAERANSAADAVCQHNTGDTVDAFQQWWNRDDGPRLRLLEDAIAAQLIGAVLMIFAAMTLALKIAFIVQLIILLVQVTMAIAAAVATFGASTATVPGFVAATRIICQRLVKQIVKQVQTLLRRILEQAKRLLKLARKVGAKRAARKVERQIANDLKRVNPKFDTSTPDYSANCTHCVQTYELRRRGIDVEATPLPKPYHPYGGRPLADIENTWGRKFTSGGQGDIEKAFENFGPGSRGVVAIQWKNGGGHVFNVENVGGKVRFVDGQNAGREVSSYFGQGHGTSYVRLDDIPMPGGLTQFTRPPG
ncbi:toxin glutamine deamidase domain-containing protein [Micromonospora olivasterospora]|uniref:Papain fold toxin 1 (Glutamine deamidase) of polymorphic toxin system n=1 Tax=Micromonospora olivasterospora TaxID=1880 RepID=A0A562I749_MICOL|nr:toxin glutamine deamidase domain-containing protein [Micromonospora olivasterospora]TWH66545.1 papain fold toxin 1 (glutamine deamidase) of polymorphic toxin system [Micromonospora olivasterospora]